MRRWLLLWHRWLGVALCLPMAMWFASGVVMMYVGYPKLSDAERLARLPALDADDVVEGPAAALARAGIAARDVDRMRLTASAGRAHWTVVAGGTMLAIDASTGRAPGVVGPTRAVAAAAAFAGTARVAYLDRVDEDAFTHSRALDPHRPLHRVDVDDDAGTRLWVSSRTGEVVRDATRAERGWNLVGAWIHWLYPLRGGALDAAWRDAVVWTSVAATVLAMSGLVVGTLRWRFASRWANGTRSPYRERWMRWHHVAGVGFGAIALAWIFSGLMSMNPWKVFGTGGVRLDERAFRAGTLDVDAAPRDAVRALARLAAAGFAPRELEWRLVDGEAFVVGVDDARRTRIVPLAGDAVARDTFDAAMLERAATRLLPGARPARVAWLHAWDLHYYPRAPHTMHGHEERRLPALRVEYDDAAATWVHVDPYTGRVLARSDTRQRAKRWLFAMLHSWDWPPLLARRPLWDVLLIAASAGGLVLSASGVVIGVRRVRRRAGLRIPPARSCRSSAATRPPRAPPAGSPR